MNVLLFCGIMLRVIVCFTAGPFNPDWHFQVIQYTAAHGWPPISNYVTPDGVLYAQSYHPPLYYLLMAPLYLLKPVSEHPVDHFASLFISCINLILIRWLLDQPLVAPHRHARALAMAFACFLPEFVMFGSFVSNDTLTMLIGTLIFWLMLSYIMNPTRGRLIWLAVLTGLGLLTKGTFLLTGFALAIVVLLVELRRDRQRVLSKLALFCLIFAVLGCYKYVENIVYWGRPIVHNLDAGGRVYESQLGTWKGPQTLYDINVIKLIRRPILQTKNTFSYPLLMYGTFWYPHIPESTYRGNVFGYAWVGSITYALAVVPTLLFLMGLVRGIGWMIQMFRDGPDQRSLISGGATLLLLSNLAVVIGAGIKYDAWSCFQSRLCFQSMMPVLMLFGAGVEILPSKKWLQWPIFAVCWLTVACGVLYFAIEVPLSMNYLPRGPEVLP